eukprot:126797-Chlamydomonas_euryale.AAC.1
MRHGLALWSALSQADPCFGPFRLHEASNLDKTSTERVLDVFSNVLCQPSDNPGAKQAWPD